MSASDEEVLLQVEGKIAKIIFNKPKKLNALNGPNYQRIGVLLREIAEMKDITITVLMGTGRFFSAGADVTQGRKVSAELSDVAPRFYYNSTFGAQNTELTRAFLEHPKVLVAALNGPAVGLSAAIVAMCDLVYCVPTTFLLTPFSSIGLVAEGGASYTFTRRMGYGLASEALLASKRITADRLLAAGFVNKIFDEKDADKFNAVVIKHVSDELGEHLNQESILLIKKLIRDAYMKGFEEANVLEVAGGVERFLKGVPQAEFGITGYIGGTTATTLASKHPEYEITALIRNTKQGDQVKAVFPKIRTVLGDLDSLEIIKEESTKADIVFHCASSDHLESVQAILAGLGSQSRKTYYVHTTGVFHFFTENVELDTPTEKVWSDIDDLKALHDLPVGQPHGPIDKLVLSRGGYENVNVAMVDPPAVYGKGTGPLKNRGTLLPILAKASLLSGKAVKLGKGSPTWSAVHVEILGEIFTWLFEQASMGGGKADWNEKGWYMAENDTYNWSELAESLGKIGQAKGYFESAEVESITLDQAKEILKGDWVANILPLTLGAAVRIKADRLKSLGLTFDKPSCVATLDELLDLEAATLGIEAKK
ncbi:hypothetical protein H072_3082 [Dactylellina haptotyla CBS 200.50]|uniref:Semialdehyde dehydrogenase NAD-binding domain-containing protein n=1 Tax=Dactylellina haptotyla (strain CBS 200.50) TaxID=1284197 RepID=S8C5J9_DACHA|nr:hypothetical protein H072_3082 [Dactylellina haptotyla CBS 200.50]